MIDIYEMQIFLAAAETGNFSEAGRRLQMSQPAISMQIRSLENRLGVELFHRAGRHIKLSEVGHTLVPMARDLVNHSIRIQESIDSLQGEVVGILKLACSTTAGKYILPKLISGFLDLHPSVRVACAVVTRGMAIDMMLNGEAHLAITSLREPYKEIEYRHFTGDAVVLIVPPDHDWAQREFITVKELHEGTFITREEGSGTCVIVSHALTEHDVSMKDLPVVMTLGNSEAIHMAVAEGIGVAFISRLAASEGIITGRVVEVPVKGLEVSQQLYMARISNRAATSAQSAFWDYVYSPENQHLLESEML